MTAGVVLRSADDRTALFTQWLAPHLPMVRGLVRRHTYFVGERADDYQTAVLHLLEHLDDLAHFALCLTVRRDTAKLRDATANRPAPADEPSAQPTTTTALDFDKTHDAVDESALHPDERAPYLYTSAAEIDESAASLDETLREVDEDLCEIDTAAVAFDEISAEDKESLREMDETLRGDDEPLRAIDTAAVDFDAMTDTDEASLREVDETLPTDDEDLRTIDTAAGNFEAMTDTDDESLREVDETRPAVDEDLRTIDTATGNFEALTDADEASLREVDETLPADDDSLCAIDTATGNFDTLTDTDEASLRGAFDETPAEDATRAAAEDERQPYADAAPDGAEQTPAPLPVTAEEVLCTVGDFNPRPWLAGVTLRLLSTLNHRALRHRETHLTPASAGSDELFDPADPDGDLWRSGRTPRRRVRSGRRRPRDGRRPWAQGVSERGARRASPHATPHRHGRRRRRAPMPATSERLPRPRLPPHRLRARRRRQQPGADPRRRASGRAAQWTTAWNAGTANSRVGVFTARAAAACGTPCGPVRNRRIQPSPTGRCCVPRPRRPSPPSHCATAPSCC